MDIEEQNQEEKVLMESICIDDKDDASSGCSSKDDSSEEEADNQTPDDLVVSGELIIGSWKSSDNNRRLLLFSPTKLKRVNRVFAISLLLGILVEFLAMLVDTKASIESVLGITMEDVNNDSTSTSKKFLRPILHLPLQACVYSLSIASMLLVSLLWHPKSKFIPSDKVLDDPTERDCVYSMRKNNGLVLIFSGLGLILAAVFRMLAHLHQRDVNLIEYLLPPFCGGLIQMNAGALLQVSLSPYYEREGKRLLD